MLYIKNTETGSIWATDQKEFKEGKMPKNWVLSNEKEFKERNDKFEAIKAENEKKNAKLIAKQLEALKD
jgi:hypothetical protein